MNLNKLNPWVLSATLCFYNGVNALQESKGYVPVLDGEGYVQDYQAKPFPWFPLGLFGGLGAIAWKNRRQSGGRQVITYKPTNEIIEALRAGILTQDDLPMALDLSRYPEFVPQEKPLEPADRLVEEIAFWTLTKKRSIVFAAVPGCGKTTLLLTVLEQMLRQSDGNMDLLINDPKYSRWLGLESRKGVDGKPVVIYPEFADSLIQFNERLDWVKKEMSRRKQMRNKGEIVTTPLLIIVDEWPSLKMYLNQAKKETGITPDDIIEKIALILMQGREDSIYLWFVAQGHQCNTLGLSGDMRGNFGVVALADPEDRATIEAVVSDQYFLKVKEEREALITQFAHHKNDGYLYFSALTAHKYIAPSPRRDDSIKELDLFAEVTPEPKPSTPDPWEESTII
jgi:hypothetical protein